MQEPRILSENGQFDLIIERLCYELIETFDDSFDNAVLVGIQTGGVTLAQRLHAQLNRIVGGKLNLPFGKLDITFYRDDFRRRSAPLAASTMDMPFLVEDKRVILVDDVLYTGRSVQAALTALNHYGRPKSVDLVVLVNRRFNKQVPIRPDFCGMAVDSLEEAYIEVAWNDEKTTLTEGGGKIIFFPQKIKSQS